MSNNTTTAITGVLGVTEVLSVTLPNGKVLPFRPYVSAKGNAGHGILRNGKAAGRYGVNVTPEVIGDTLPVYVEVFGHRIGFEAGLTDSGNVKVTAGASIKVNGVPMTFNLRISQQLEANGKLRGYNVSGVLCKQGAGTGAARTTSL